MASKTPTIDSVGHNLWTTFTLLLKKTSPAMGSLIVNSVIVLASITMLSITDPAGAQDIGSGSTTASLPLASEPHTDGSSESGIGDIIVTAQRRSENIQRVPVSVTALTADVLGSRNLNNISQIALAAPSLQLGVFGNFSIRGVGTITNADSVDSSVAVAVDDVNIGRPNLVVDLFNDVQQVEILNGPQGLLFGRNASAGLLNISTTRPVLNRLQNNFSFEAAALGRPGEGGGAASLILRETANIPITGTSALRINSFFSYAEPPVTILGSSAARQDTAQRQYGFRGKYLADLTENLRVYVIGEYAESHGGIANYSFRAIGGPQSLSSAQLTADGITAGPNNFLQSSKGAIFRDVTNWGLQGTIAYTFSNGFELSDIAAYKKFDSDQQYDLDFTSANGIDINEDHSKYDQFSNELRLALPSTGRLSGQAGLYFFQSHTASKQNTEGSFFFPSEILPGAPFCVGTPITPDCPIDNAAVIGRDVHYRILNRSYAAFGQLTFEVVSGLTLIGGARVTRDVFTISQQQNLLDYFIPLGPRATYDQSARNTNFSWKGGAQYQFLPTIMTYVTYGRGYKGPGSNDSGAQVGSNLIVKPETSDNLEIGIKSSFFDKKLVFNVSAFQTKFKNYQSESFDAAATTFIIQNAGSLTSKGAELTLLIYPFKRFSMNATAAYLDAKFDSFPGAQCYPGQPSPGCADTGAFDASGFRAPAAPRFTSSFQATYEIPISRSAIAFVEGNYYHRSSINYQINAAAGSAVSAIDVLGGSLGVRVGEGTRIAVFCKNCTNVKYPTFILSDPIDATVNTSSFDQAFGPDSVRTVGFSGSLRF